MDFEDLLPRKRADPLGAVVTQDLDALSVEDLHERLRILEGEVARTRARIDAAVNHLSSAAGLFKR